VPLKTVVFQLEALKLTGENLKVVYSKFFYSKLGRYDVLQSRRMPHIHTDTGLLNKSSCLAPALGVTKFTNASNII
jgi:hypothetical protein